jgi:hypothetical protein
MFIVDEPSGLLTVNSFHELVVQKSIADVQLMNWPLGECEHHANGSQLDDGGERLVKVDARALNVVA